MKSSTAVVIAAAIMLSGGCADDLLLDERLDDGSIRFAVTEGEALTRGAISAPEQWMGSLCTQQGQDSLWLHVSEAENLQASSSQTPTRCKPFGASSGFDSFHLSASTGEDAEESKFILNETVTPSGNYWHTSATYYWPREEVTFYAIGSNTAGFDAANTVIGNGVSGFDYTVPKGSGESAGRDAECQPDLILATTKSAKPADGVAHLQFRHPLAGIYFTADKTVLNIGIRSLAISGIYGEGRLRFEGTLKNSPAKWTFTGKSPNATFTQLTDEQAESSFEVNGSAVNSLCEPFMLIPQKIPEGAVLRVTLENDDVREIPLADIFSNGNQTARWEGGKIYHIHFSKLDALYPPVRNLQGMTGNNMVSLTWFYPNPDQIFPHVHQVGVYIEVQQFATNGQQIAAQGPTISRKIYWPDAETGGVWPDSSDMLDLFAEMKNGVDAEGNPCAIDTHTYDRFKVKVYAAYLNESDAWEPGEKHKINLSVAANLTVDRSRSNETVAFYMPEGTGWDKTKDPVDCLLDDDDKAAADWFMDHFAKGIFVNHANFAEMKKKYGFNVIWFPCGVHLTGGDPDGGPDMAHEYDFWLSKGSYVINKMDLSRTDVEFIRHFINDPLPTPMGFKYYDNECPANMEPYQEVNGFNTFDTYDNIFTERICHWKNLYNDGIIKHFDGGDYVSDTDKALLRDFYLSGGSLLLSTFALELVADLEVCEDVPATDFFNEVKQPAIWFVEPNMDGSGNNHSSHPIYRDLFAVVPETFRDVYLSDFIDTDGDGIGNPGKDNYKYYHAGRDKVPYFLGGIVGRKMIPLLSNHALACENNNCIWYIGGGRGGIDQRIKAWGGTVLGTWGQRVSEDDAAIVEFAPKTRGRNNGRCLCIGLGAYEFNNGMEYDLAGEVKNAFQSNVHQLTLNALEYLLEEN